MFIDDGLKGFVIKFNLEYTEESHNSHNYPIYIYIYYMPFDSCKKITYVHGVSVVKVKKLVASQLRVEVRKDSQTVKAWSVTMVKILYWFKYIEKKECKGL